jgi:hypothetical protein
MVTNKNQQKLLITHKKKDYVSLVLAVTIVSIIGIGWIGYIYMFPPVQANYDVEYARGYNAGFEIGNSTGYLLGYSEGNSTGYAQGFAEGNNSGYIEGFEEGNLTGFEDGNLTGVDFGYILGFLEGNSTGYIAGYLSGYNEAYNIGFEAGLLSGYYSYWNDQYVVMISNNLVSDYPLYFAGNWKGSGISAGYYVVEFKLNYQMLDFITYNNFGYLHSNGLPSRTSIVTTAKNMTFTYNLPVSIWIYNISAIITSLDGYDVVFEYQIADFNQNPEIIPADYPEFLIYDYGLKQINIFFNTTTTFNSPYVEDIIFNNYQIIPLYQIEE